MAAQKASIVTSRQEIGELREQMAQLRAFIEQLQQQRRDDQQQAQQQQAEITALRARLGVAGRATDGGVGVAGERTRTAAPARSPHGKGNRGTSRRRLLSGAGAVAAAAVALVASEGQRAHAAPAADGDTIVMGTAHTNASASGTILTPAILSSPVTLLDADNSSTLTADLLHSSGVTGRGPSGGNGLMGIANGINGKGIWGQSDAGIGVLAQSGTGYDLWLGGAGLLYQIPQATVGAPTGGSHFPGEQIRDANADLYICVGSGTPGKWKKVAAIPAGAAGGASVLFATPYRIFDTRDLSGVPFNNGAGNNPMTPTQIKTLQITGTVDPNDSSIVVPSGATGIIGNLIAITPAGEGFLGIQPSTGGANSRAWVNYEANITIDNAVIVGLSTDGKIDIQCNTANSGAALTITGYII